MNIKKTSKNPFHTLLKNFENNNASKKGEKSRLEAFINAFPGEYCGLNKDGSVAYSNGFCSLLGLSRVKSFTDIQACLEPGDSAALEGLHDRLIKHKTPFTLPVKTISGANLTISGTVGQDTGKSESIVVLWLQKQSLEKPAQEQPPPPPNIERRNQDSGELLQVQTALNSIPRPLWLRDMQQNIVWCNTTYADYLGMSVGDIITQQKEIAAQALKKKTGEDIQPGRTLATESLKKGEALEAKAHAVVHGKRMLMKISEIPMGPLGMTLGIAYNITREEELETELQRYQSSNKELLEQLRSAIAIFTADEKLEFYNSAFSQLWGLDAGWLNKSPTLGEIMEKLRETRRLPEQSDFRRFKQSWLSMFTGLIEPHEDMLFLPDGSTYRMLVIPHSMGGLMMNFEDATSRLALESSYNTLVAVQKETLDNLAEGVAVYGGDGRLKLWNPAFARLWDLHPETLEGEPHISKIVDKMKGFFDPGQWTKIKDLLMKTALERMMHDGRLERENDTLLEYSTMPLPDGGVLISYADITDTVRVENALREKNAALEAAERLKMDFLANVSYQLRTPLNAIIGFNEILDQEYFGPLNKRQKEYTRDMKEASERLVSLINDILDLSTLEAGYMTMSFEDIKIYDTMQAVFELMNDWARKEKIEIKMTCPKNIGTLHADEKRIKQALVNVIRNAITFTPAGGEIELKASKSKDGIKISVHDTGIGITEEDRLRIFEPFERAGSGADRARLSRSGAGLGLSLVRNITHLHGGNVELESEKGKGTTVTLFFPFLSTKTDLKLPIKPKT